MTARNRNLAAAIVLVSALFADRAIHAAPASTRPLMAEVAGRLMERLTTRLQKVVPGVRMAPARRDGTSRVPMANATAPGRSPARLDLSPFAFRLPPPGV
jgi:hypothetical protein